MIRKLIWIFLLTLLTGCLMIKPNNTKKLNNIDLSEQYKEGKIKIRNSDITILLGCGIGGQISDQIIITNELVKGNNYTALIENLKSKDIFTQLLSGIALDKLNRNGKVTLSVKENEIISKMKFSTKSFSACLGCTEHYTGQISDIFSYKDSLDILKTIQIEIGLGGL